jgi:hypothetical protein
MSGTELLRSASRPPPRGTGHGLVAPDDSTGLDLLRLGPYRRLGKDQATMACREYAITAARIFALAQFCVQYFLAPTPSNAIRLTAPFGCVGFVAADESVGNKK